ncbi:MAG: hypothetical protein ACREIV_13340, partial [Planctomycetaceae bacterium]
GPLRYAFRPGPFNWEDHEPWPITRRLKSFVGLDDPAKDWQHPPQTVYAHEGFKVEIVDFYSRSKTRAVPYLRLDFQQPVKDFQRELELEYREYEGSLNRYGFAREDFLPGVGDVLFWKTDDPKQQQAFLRAVPQQSADGNGAIVIWHNGEVYQVPVSRLERLKEDGTPYELDDGLSVELVRYARDLKLPPIPQLLDYFPWKYLGMQTRFVSLGPNVDITITDTRGGETQEWHAEQFADFPFYSRSELPENMHVAFWHPDMLGRIDILQGPDGELVYRVWQQKLQRVVHSGELKLGEPVPTWSMGSEEDTWQMTLAEHVVSSGPDTKLVSRSFQVPVQELSSRETWEDELVIEWLSRPIAEPFSKDDAGGSRQVKLRVTWTEKPQS